MGGLPFFISGQLDFLRSIFESTSGWTTTGITMLDLNNTPHIFLFYSSLMQFLGGIGFVLLMLMFASGTEAMELFSAEGHPDKLEPNLIGTARLMMTIYVGFTAIGMVLYMICGMSWFDAIIHSMSAMATGGFSTHPESIAFFNSTSIEVVTIILMLLGGTNFSILALLVKRQFKKISKIGELRFLLCLLTIFIALLTFVGFKNVYNSFGESLRVSIFHTVATITSTGFFITSIQNWHPTMLMCTIFLMLIGGGVGSTSGGIKYTRLYILYKSFITHIEEKFMPARSVKNVAIYKPTGKSIIPTESLLQIHHFVIVYLITFLIGSLLLTFGGLSIEEAIFDFSSFLGTMGLSIGTTSRSSSNYVLIIQMIGMLLARLEVYVVYIFFAAGIKKVSRTIRNR